MRRFHPGVLFLIGFLCLASALLIAWNSLQGATSGEACAWPPAQTAASLTSGTVTTMDSPVFTYTPGWRVSAAGADPPEPADPFSEPAGVVTFPYTGNDLYLLLAPGDYWAYLFVNIDGQPANRLPVIADNTDSEDAEAGYKPLLAPERAGDTSTLPLLVHHSDEAAGTHTARIEVWRGWGQTPLTGVAVDPVAAASCNKLPLWPAVLLALVGLGCLGVGLWQAVAGSIRRVPGAKPTEVGWEEAGISTSQPVSTGFALNSRRFEPAAGALAGLGMLLVAGSVAFSTWWLCLPGLALLALAGVMRPTLWLAALLFGLPFAYGIKLPLLPTRPFDLIDIGVWGGTAVLLAHLGVALIVRIELRAVEERPTPVNWPLWALGAVTGWALVSASGANYTDLALREWRVLFLNALVFGVVLAWTLRLASDPQRNRWILMTAWLAGGTVVALFGLWGYVVGNDLVSQAEGVRRIQAFYGSGNNLALYLDRTLAVSLALTLFTHGGRQRLLWGLLAAPQALAWLLTFSKGSLFLAAPALALVLLIGGGSLLRREGRSLRPLWLLLGLGALAILVLAPFLGAERFQRLLDFGQGTGFLRLQLWRSAWQMALDHPLLGVGPDNFLYAYRSGYLLPTAWQEPNLNHPHTLLLDWWTRLGIPGLLLGLTWLGTGIVTILRWLQRGPERALALGVLAACAAALAHGLIDVSYALPELMIVWVLLFGIRPMSIADTKL